MNKDFIMELSKKAEEYVKHYPEMTITIEKDYLNSGYFTDYVSIRMDIKVGPGNKYHSRRQISIDKLHLYDPIFLFDAMYIDILKHVDMKRVDPWFSGAMSIEREKINYQDYYLIREVIFNDPATIVFWSDGTKTIVKCSEGDTFDQEKGLAMAFMKKKMGNGNSYHKIFKRFIKETK